VDLPETYDEAIARGYTPISADQARHAMSNKKSSHFRAFALDNVNCEDPANAGRVCSVYYGDHGRAVLLTCQGGTCAPESALLAPAAE
jgi:hypothetical protein